MDQASGWSLRFASWLLWASTLATCLQAFAACMFTPLLAASRRERASLFSPASFLRMVPVTILMVLPGVLHWWMAMDRKTTLLKTPLRAAKAAAFVLTSSLASVLCINLTLQHPAIQAPGAAPTVASPLTAPFGLSAALVVLSLQLDRPRFAAIHQPRWTRLSDLAAPIATTALLTWLLTLPLAAAAYVFTPLTLPNALDVCLAGVAALAFTAMLLAGAVLTGLVLAERPGLVGGNSSDQSLVLAQLVHGLQTQQHPVDRGIILQEVATRSSYFGAPLWLPMFEDHLGAELWQPLAMACLEPLHALCEAAALFSDAFKNSASKKQAEPKWNPIPTVLVTASRKPVLPEQRALEEHALRHGDAAARAAAVLTDAALHSHAHDTYALLQMPPAGVPGVADVVHVLLAAYALLDNCLLLRQKSVARGPLTLLIVAASLAEQRCGLHLRLLCPTRTPQPGLAQLEAVHACLAQSLSRLRGAFGSVLKERWAEATMFENLLKAPVDIAAMSAVMLGG